MVGDRISYSQAGQKKQSYIHRTIMTGKSQFPLLELEEGGRFNTEDMSTGRSGYHVIQGGSLNRTAPSTGQRKDSDPSDSSDLRRSTETQISDEASVREFSDERHKFTI